MQIIGREKDTKGNMSVEAESQTGAKLDQGGKKAKIIGKDNRVLCLVISWKLQRKNAILGKITAVQHNMVMKQCL